MNTVAVLKKVDLFGGLAPDGMKALAAVSSCRSLDKGDTLFLEGRRGDAVFVLESGNLQLLKTTAGGGEVVIATIEPGQLFAEAVLFERDDYPVSAIALKKSIVLAIRKSDFMTLLEQAGFRAQFITSLMKRLRYLADRIVNLTSCSVEERFFMFIAEHYGRKECYTIPISKKDFAAAIGTTPESLSRLVFRLTRKGLVSWKGRILKIRPGAWKN